MRFEATWINSGSVFSPDEHRKWSCRDTNSGLQREGRTGRRP